MIISRGTTPTFEFKLPQTKDNYNSILISFGQNGKKILDKQASDLNLISGTTYSLELSETDINKFDDGVFDVQVRVKKSNKVAASKIYSARIVDVINDTVLDTESEVEE